MSAVPEDGTILGVNIRWLVVAPHAMDRSMGYCVVLVADEDGDYAAYAGIIREDHSDAGRPNILQIDCIKRHGDKLTFEEACIHFPGGGGLVEFRYRQSMRSVPP